MSSTNCANMNLHGVYGMEYISKLKVTCLEWFLEVFVVANVLKSQLLMIKLITDWYVTLYYLNIMDI